LSCPKAKAKRTLVVRIPINKPVEKVTAGNTGTCGAKVYDSSMLVRSSNTYYY
jgi:hypothetical protein